LWISRRWQTVRDEWPFGSMPMMQYGMIMADPAWKFDNWSKKGELKNASAKYDCMPLEDIKALPVNQLAGRDCVLFLWATNPMLREAFEVMDAWGFRFVTAGTWVKTTATGKPFFGTGYWLRSSNEPFLIGVVGNPPTPSPANVRSVITAPAREHSRKPDEAYAVAERLTPPTAMRRADLFSRQSRPGWDSWGNEATKFDEKIEIGA